MTVDLANSQGKGEKKVMMGSLVNLVNNTHGAAPAPQKPNKDVTVPSGSGQQAQAAGQEVNWAIPNVLKEKLKEWEGCAVAAAGNPKRPEESESDPDYAWFCCILWEPSILQKLEEHRNKWGSQRYSTLSIAKKLSELVKEDNEEMDCEKPFKLLQLVGTGYEGKDDQFIIQVAEMATANNAHLPEPSRRYNLVLNDNRDRDQRCLAEEITRLPTLLTIIMLWNFEVDDSSEPHKTIRLKKPHSDCNPSILIFHGEPFLGRPRIQKMLHEFHQSELKHFGNPKIQTRNKWKLASKEDQGKDSLAIHLYRPYRTEDVPGEQSPTLYIEDSTDYESDDEEEQMQMQISAPTISLPPPPPAPPQPLPSPSNAPDPEPIQENGISEMASIAAAAEESQSDYNPSQLALLLTQELEVDNNTGSEGD